MVLDPHRPGRAFLATEQGLYLVNEAGGEPERLSARRLSELEIDPHDPDLFLASPVAVAPAPWESGAFWFYDPAVPDVAVEVVDGRAVDGAFWVVVDGLSAAGYQVRVVDTATGAVRAYVHPEGPPASLLDRDAFR